MSLSPLIALERGVAMATTVNSTAKDAGRPSCSEALPEGNTGALELLGESVGLAGSGEDDDEVRDRDATTAVAVDTIGLTQTSILAESSQAEEPTKKSTRGRPPKSQVDLQQPILRKSYMCVHCAVRKYVMVSSRPFSARESADGCIAIVRGFLLQNLKSCHLKQNHLHLCMH